MSNNSQVAHSFIYGNSDKSANMWSTGNDLYSYNSLLATKYEGLILVSHNIATYSNTSSRHMSHLFKATYDTSKLIHIYHASIYNLKSFEINQEVSHVIQLIKDMLIKQERARVTDYFYQIESHINDLTLLMNVFKVDKRSKAYKDYLRFKDIDKLKEGYKELIDNYAKLEQKRKKAKQLKEYKKKLTQLEKFTGVSMKNYSVSEINTYDFLMIKDEDTLCTSQKLCVSLQDAKMLYAMLTHGKNIIGSTIGYYTILNHNNKYVTIGCHKILLKELKRVLS